GGQFTSLGATPRSHIALVSASGGGSPSSWNPNIQGGGVYTIAVSGGIVYAGGAFANVGGVTRNCLAAFDGSGSLTSWDPEPNGAIYGLAVDGPRLYVAGAYSGFTPFPSKPRFSLAAFDIPSGLLTDWDPKPNNVLQCVAVSGATIYAG